MPVSFIYEQMAVDASSKVLVTSGFCRAFQSVNGGV